MSAIGPKRTSLAASHMSAFGGKAEIAMTNRNVRYDQAIATIRGYDVRKGQGGHRSRAEPLPRRATTFGRQSPKFVVNSRS
jgi:hypothetical protein